MVAEQIDPTHPIVSCPREAVAALAESTAFEPVFMTASAKKDALLTLAELERRTAGLKLRLMAASADLADADGARDVAAWLASRTHAELRPLRAEQRLAGAVDDKWPVLGKAMADGQVSLEQAQAIVAALEALPARVGLEVIAKAEAHLVALAAEHDPKELRVLGRRILDLIAPEIAEGEEARRLEEEEQRARDNCRLTLKPLGDSTTRISGLIPATSADRLATYLHAFTSPRKHPDAISGEEDRIPYRRQLAQAFCSLLEHLDPNTLPEHGGDATTLMVTIGLESLKKDLGVGSIIGGESMSATAIRRLACTAAIIPVVLGGNGEVLDLGRTRRLFSKAQRKALRLLHQTCQGEGCTIPAGWGDAHHDKPWATGGKTDLAHGRLYCNWHHHRAHDPTYQATLLPHGKIRFTRRT